MPPLELDLEALAKQPAPGTPEARAPLSLDLGALAKQQPTGQRAAPTPGLKEEFGRGLNVGVDTLQGSLGGGLLATVGDALGLEGVQRAGMDISNRQAIEAFENLQPSDVGATEDFFRWAAAGLGQTAPSIALSMGTGGLGAVLGRQLLRQGIKRAVFDNAWQQWKKTSAGGAPRKEVLKRLMRLPETQERLREAMVAGSAGGAFAGSAPPQIGSIYEELANAGIQEGAAGTAIAAGTAGGLLDAAPVAALFDKFFPGVDKALAKSFVREVAETTGQQAALEGSTESLQEVLAIAAHAYHDPTVDLLSSESKERMTEAFALGALAGAVTGGAGQSAAGGARRANRAIVGRIVEANILDEVSAAGSRATDSVRSHLASVFDSQGEVARIVRDGLLEDGLLGPQRGPKQPGPETGGPQEEAETLIPTKEELVQRVNQIVDEQLAPAFNGAKERVVRQLRRAGLLNSSVGAAHVGIIKRALIALDAEIESELKPALETLRTQLTKEWADLQTDIANLDKDAAFDAVENFLSSIQERVAALRETTVAEAQQKAEARTAERVDEALKNVDLDPEAAGEFDPDGFAEEEPATEAATAVTEAEATPATEPATEAATEQGQQASVKARKQKMFQQVTNPTGTRRQQIDDIVAGLQLVGERVQRTVIQNLPLEMQAEVLSRVDDIAEGRRSAREDTTPDEEATPEQQEVEDDGPRSDEERVVILGKTVVREDTLAGGRKRRERTRAFETIEEGNRVVRHGGTLVPYALGRDGGPSDAAKAAVKELQDQENEVSRRMGYNEPMRQFELVEHRNEEGEVVGHVIRQTQRQDLSQGAGDLVFDSREGAAIPVTEFFLNWERKAMESAQRNPDKKRHVRWGRGKGARRYDLPTLIEMGQAMDVDSSTRSEREKVAVGMANAQALFRMMDRNASGGEVFLDLNDKSVVNGKTGMTWEDVRAAKRPTRQTRDAWVYWAGRRIAQLHTEMAKETATPQEKAEAQAEIDRLLDGVRKIDEEVTKRIGLDRHNDTQELAEDGTSEPLEMIHTPTRAFYVDEEIKGGVFPNERAAKTELKELEVSYPTSRFEVVAEGDGFIIVETLNPVSSNLDPTMDVNLDDTGDVSSLDSEEAQNRRSARDLGRSSPSQVQQGRKRSLFRDMMNAYLGINEGGPAPWETPANEARRARMAEIREQLDEIRAGRRPAEQRPALRAELLRLRRQRPVRRPRRITVNYAPGRGRMRNAVEELVTSLADLMGLHNSITVVDDAGLAEVGKKLAAKERRSPGEEALLKKLREVARDKPKARAIFYKDSVLIYTNPEISARGAPKTAKEAALIGHELGHVVFQVYFHRLSDSARQRLYDAYFAENPDRAAWAVDPSGVPHLGTEARSFEEWMANQFVGWLARRDLNRGGRATQLDLFLDQNSKSEVLTFFQRMADRFMRMLDWLRSKFGVTETASQFFDGVAKAAQREGSAWFHDSIVHHQDLGYRWFGEIPTHKNFTIPETRDKIPESVKRRLKAAGRTFKSGKSGTLKGTLAHAGKVLFATLNGRIRSMAKQYPALDPLVEFLRPVAGKAGQSYVQAVNIMNRTFSTRANEILSELDKLSPQDRDAILDELVSEEGNVRYDATVKVRKLFSLMGQYAREAGLPIPENPTYFPRVLNREALQKNRDEIIERAKQRLKMTQEEAEHFYAKIITEYQDEAARRALAGNATETADKGQQGLATPYAEALQGRKMSREDYDFIFESARERDLRAVLHGYIPSMVKAAEFNRKLGDTRKTRTKWDKTRQLKQILMQARRQGATEEEIQEIQNIVDTYLGRRGTDLKPETTALMSALMTYQNVRLLLFATLASLPDLVTPAVRANSLNTMLRAFHTDWRDAVKSDSDLARMARTWGVIADTLNESAVADHFTSSFMTSDTRRINDAFFKATGLIWWTNFTRKAALATGKQYLIDHAARASRGNRESIKRLQELGLTAADVKGWMDDGYRVYGQAGYMHGDEAPGVTKGQLDRDKKIRNAMVRFVDEAVMRPDAGQRPAWASDPAFMLFWHLKSFAYSFQQTVLDRMWHEMKQDPKSVERMMLPLLHLSLMLPMTALGLELREFLQYTIAGRTPRTNRMSGLEYMSELVTRSGIFGAGQLALDIQAANNRNQFPMIGIAGPTIGQMYEAVTKPASQSVPKALPVAGQLPWARDAVRDLGWWIPEDRKAAIRDAGPYSKLFGGDDEKKVARPEVTANSYRGHPKHPKNGKGSHSMSAIPERLGGGVLITTDTDGDGVPDDAVRYQGDPKDLRGMFRQ